MIFLFSLWSYNTKVPTYMSQLQKNPPHVEELTNRVSGEVYVDRGTRGVYATDASHYQLEPAVVVVPRDEADVVAALKVASEHKLPVTPRGGGTSLSGQTVGRGMILDVSKYMDKILEINTAEKWARVQPGIVRDNLNAELARHGLLYAPDPATTSRANVGGMIGNNSSGSRSIIYGKTSDHLLEVKIALADGQVLILGTNAAEAGSCHDDILRGVQKIVDENRDEIAARYPRVMRNVMGYNLKTFVDHPGEPELNLAKLFCGSEGTLGVLLEAKINLVDVPKHAIICVVHFAELLEAIRAVESIVQYGPSAVEILGHDIIELVREVPNLSRLAEFIEGDPQAVLLVEFFGTSQEEVEDKMARLVADLKGRRCGYAWPIRRTPAERAAVWEVRKGGLGIMLNIKGDAKPSAFIEDAAVPLEHLPEYIEQIIKYCTELDIKVAMYAHASVGLIHVRPVMDFRRGDHVEKMKLIAERSFELVQKFHGAVSGEHGDGMVRSPFVERFYGPKLYSAFREVKRLFDPAGLMNPGKILDAEPMDRNLRFGAAYHVDPIATEFHYLDHGSFAQTVHACTGLGVCRQSLKGTMCPSYRATREEAHSTRGRANALRLAMSGQLPDGMTNQDVYDILDLCLSCKACKSECPSGVDMARLKSEFLQKYRDKHGLTRRDKLIRDSRRMAERYSGFLAPLVNFIQSTSLFRVTLEKLAGFDRRRTLPTFARQTLQSWFAKRNTDKRKSLSVPPEQQRKIVLFDDTFASYHEPQVGIAAVELLESCGYEVILAQAGCCQRPRISNGFLREAKTDGGRTIRALDEYIQKGMNIVVLEPSCYTALVDDLPDLLGDRDLQNRMKAHVKMIDVFLRDEKQSGKCNVQLEPLHKNILVHGHCHQKSSCGTGAMMESYRDTPGLTAAEIDAGCCGMAGAFGYEKEHYDLSLKVGEDRLFPAIRSCTAGTAVVACGFSCRHQIQSVTGVEALHWTQTLRGVHSVDT